MNISIKDRPIISKSEDQLKVAKYAQALINFIIKSDTPITIGLQGEWGTGKTSLMYMLREALDNMNVATSWVNTWEYSMFRGAKETTPAVLNGLLTTLEESCGKNWTIRQETEKAMKKIGRFFGNLVNQVASSQLGVDVRAAAELGTESISRAEIAQIKADISEVINKLIADTRNPYQRVVFFVDDLDRINPSDAVEVLEALKNMFDMNHCIFVLAIDYDVVVKGLEGKFGKKTDENEREFRSFFDKIIQVPFSMPTGAYDIDNFLDKKMADLGMKIPDHLKQIYLDVVKNSVGYNPRSLKRFMNTFSLLNTIRKTELETNNEQSSENQELMLFTLLGIQITYPKIFRHLGISPDYKNWNQAFAARNGLDWSLITEKVKEYGENELIDEDWEKVVWGLCQSDAYLKSKVFSILELLNTISEQFGAELDEIMQAAMEFAAITSVDDNQEAKQSVVKIGEKRIRFTGVDAKKQQLAESKSNPIAIELWFKVFSKLDASLSKIGSKINYAKTATTFYRWADAGKSEEIMVIYCNNPKAKYTFLNIDFWGYSPEFLSDMCEILKKFGWDLSVDQINKAEKVDFAEGAYIKKGDDSRKAASYGRLTFDFSFINATNNANAEAIILAITDKLISRLSS